MGGVGAARAAEFTEFVGARSSALLRLACLLTGGDRAAAEDLLQEALAETYVRWGSIREPTAREAFVRRILTRSATRRWRKRDHIPNGQGQSTARDAVATSDSTDPVARLDMFGYLALLPPRQRAVIVLRYYEDLSESQTAAVMNSSPGTVKSHAHRALCTLRAILEAEQADLRQGQS